MSLVKTLNEYLRLCRERNFVLRNIQRVPTKLFAPSATVTTTTTLSPVRRVDDHQDTENNTLTKSVENGRVLTDIPWNLVGKGSSFHQNYVKESLKPLAYRPLRRSQGSRQREYPADEAKKFHLMEKSLERYESTVMHELNRQTITQIIETLVEITPKNDSQDGMSPIKERDAHMVYKTPRHVYSEIPPLPDLKTQPELFEEYVYQLTHSTFHYKQSSKFNGIIPKILRNLLHPLNSNTLSIRSTESFNHALFYFSRKWDIATCRELLVQMKFEGKTPTTTTYNILLNSLTTLRNIQHLSDPYKVALKHLKQMKTYRLKADLVTWNVIFGVLKDDLCKTLLLEQRIRLKIPMDNRFQYTMVKYFSQRPGMNAKHLLTLIKEFDLTLEGRTVNLISGLLIKERQFTNALKIIDFAHNGDKVQFRANREVLNQFLDEFTEIKRMDLCIGVINTFKQRFALLPDHDSYVLLLQCLAKCGYWAEKYSVLRVVYRKMIDDIGVVAGDYWLKKLRSRLKFIHDIDVELSTPLTKKELDLQSLMDGYIFENTIPRYINGRMSPEMKKAGIKMGYYASRESVSKGDPLEFQGRKKRAKNYKDNVDKISITKAMEKRLPYAKDPYGALKDELHERSIIS